MGNSTENLNLYLTDMDTDGNDTFDFDRDLNENWDKIDKSFALYAYQSDKTYQKGTWVVGTVDSKKSIYESLVDGNTGNALTDETKWKKVLLGGAGLEEQIVDLTTQLASINSKVDNYINKIVWAGALEITVGTTSLASLLPNDGHNYLVYGSSHVSAKNKTVYIQQVSSDIATTAVVPCCTDGDDGRTSHAYGFWAIPVGTGRKITLTQAGRENWIVGYYRL